MLNFVITGVNPLPLHQVVKHFPFPTAIQWLVNMEGLSAYAEDDARTMAGGHRKTDIVLAKAGLVMAPSDLYGLDPFVRDATSMPVQ